MLLKHSQQKTHTSSTETALSHFLEGKQTKIYIQISSKINRPSHDAFKNTKMKGGEKRYPNKALMP